jgi:hypothetical protein
VPNNINQPNNIAKPETARSETARANGAQSRINGAKSHGPATPEGRARSSRNSLRHGFTAKAVVLAAESREEYQALLDSFLDRFHPADAVEQELVETMAAARWRLRRLALIESTILDNHIKRWTKYVNLEMADPSSDDRLAFSFRNLSEGPTLNVLVRYEAGLTRTFERALKLLTQLQSAPRPGAVKHVGSFRSRIGPPSRDLPHPRPSVPIREPILPSAPPAAQPHGICLYETSENPISST